MSLPHHLPCHHTSFLLDTFLPSPHHHHPPLVTTLTPTHPVTSPPPPLVTVPPPLYDHTTLPPVILLLLPHRPHHYDSTTLPNVTPLLSPHRPHPYDHTILSFYDPPSLLSPYHPPLSPHHPHTYDHTTTPPSPCAPLSLCDYTTLPLSPRPSPLSHVPTPSLLPHQPPLVTTPPSLVTSTPTSSFSPHPPPCHHTSLCHHTVLPRVITSPFSFSPHLPRHYTSLCHQHLTPCHHITLLTLSPHHPPPTDHTKLRFPNREVQWRISIFRARLLQGQGSVKQSGRSKLHTRSKTLVWTFHVPLHYTDLLEIFYHTEHTQQHAKQTKSVPLKWGGGGGVRVGLRLWGFAYKQ